MSVRCRVSFFNFINLFFLPFLFSFLLFKIRCLFFLNFLKPIRGVRQVTSNGDHGVSIS